MKILVFNLSFFLFFNFTIAQIGITTAHPFFLLKENIKIVSPKPIKRNNVKVSETKGIPSAFCYKDLGFFCKIELKLDKITVTPIRFRLGSLDYTNNLEGK